VNLCETSAPFACHFCELISCDKFAAVYNIRQSPDHVTFETIFMEISPEQVIGNEKKVHLLCCSSEGHPSVLENPYKIFSVMRIKIKE
jgi:hypothetical protein